jgi:hypothetical protein
MINRTASSTVIILSLGILIINKRPASPEMVDSCIIFSTLVLEQKPIFSCKNPPRDSTSPLNFSKQQASSRQDISSIFRFEAISTCSGGARGFAAGKSRYKYYK